MCRYVDELQLSDWICLYWFIWQCQYWVCWLACDRITIHRKRNNNFFWTRNSKVVARWKSILFLVRCFFFRFACSQRLNRIHTSTKRLLKFEVFVGNNLVFQRKEICVNWNRVELYFFSLVDFFHFIFFMTNDCFVIVSQQDMMYKFNGRNQFGCVEITRNGEPK